MEKITTYLIVLCCMGLNLAYSTPGTISQFIKIDQFGYRPNDEKIAVISDPQTGYNAALSFVPGTTYQVRDWVTDAVVFSGSITVWNSGSTHAQSGDKVSWFDFTSFTTPGSYYVFDPVNNVGSYRFEVNDCVYSDVLKRAMRVFFYQRCGFSKQYPYADTGYVDGASHMGTQQDTDCRLYNNTNVSTSKDLSGGWYDAGDYNKYVNFAWGTLIDMLMAYEENPSAWFDNYNIPESGNGIPDLLDEIKYELDWLLKMQNANGSVLSVIGGGGASPPSADVSARRYGPATTSATFTASGIFALAAIQYSSAGQVAYAATLQTAAVNAWTWATANPSVTFYNSGTLAAGEQEVDAYGTLSRQLAAAVFLYALTGTSTYKTFVDNNYNQMHLLQWTYAYPFESAQQDVLLYYANLPGAATTVKNAIISAYSNSLKTNNADNLPAYTNKTDAYRAYLADNNYTWGSNTTKGHQANMLLTMNHFNLDAANAVNYKNAASGYVHYFHGVNPNSKTFLTNMGKYGAENSVTSVYHGWFHDGSALWDEVGVSTYGPAPGYVPGGVNPSYNWDACCPSACGGAANNAKCTAESIDPPKNQPIQKSWKDFNTSWPINSWEVTEPGIYTQAAYIRMLSKFLTASCNITTGNGFSHDKNQGLIQTIYPQPSDSKVSIKFYQPQSNIRFELYDISGKELVNGMNGSKTEILNLDLSSVASGIYFIKIISSEKTEIRKVIKD